MEYKYIFVGYVNLTNILVYVDQWYVTDEYTAPCCGHVYYIPRLTEEHKAIRSSGN
jgi:hypothetical protein